jgi:hypothetical protein
LLEVGETGLQAAKLFGGQHDDNLLPMPGHDLRAGGLGLPDELAEPLLCFLDLPLHVRMIPVFDLDCLDRILRGVDLDEGEASLALTTEPIACLG